MMMRCWSRKLNLQTLQGETRAAAVSKARGNQLLQGGGRSRLSFQARVPKINQSQPREKQQQQKLLCTEKQVTTLLAISSLDLNNRLFSSSAKKGEGDESGGQVSNTSSPSSAATGDSVPLMGDHRRRRAWERSLSPLERVSRLLPEELLSSEIRALRSTKIKESKEEDTPFNTHLSQEESQLGQDSVPKRLLDSTSKNIPFQAGDLIIAEIRRKRTEFKKLSQLTSSGVLNSNWGMVSHAEILGKLPGQMFRTSSGYPFLIRRPTLDEFVVLMKRGPNISYPKDINAMLLLMDISQGDTVLEAGSGSGGMSLFLSRAVGPEGHVISYEIRNDHYRVAKKNYQRWCDAWNIGHTVDWPDNVDFINEDILTAAEDLKMRSFDAIALDMVRPQKILPVIFSSLKEGGVCAVYLANITQVIELLEAIRINKLNLFCEKILEVTHRDWLIFPVAWKHGGIFQNLASQQNTDDESTWHNENDEVPTEESEENEVCVSDKGKRPYIARPYPWQIGHTVFLIKLRRFNPACLNSSPSGNC